MLKLTVLSYAGWTPPAPPTVSFSNKGGVIGRLPGCDWVLEDPDGHVSKRHCWVDYVGGQYRITDISTNGVFLNDRGNRIGFGVGAVLQDGDHLYIAAYDIGVEIVDQPQEAAHVAAAKAPALARERVLETVGPGGSGPSTPSSGGQGAMPDRRPSAPGARRPGQAAPAAAPNGHRPGAPNGHAANGHAANGHAAHPHAPNGHAVNGQAANGHAVNGHAPVPANGGRAAAPAVNGQRSAAPARNAVSPGSRELVQAFLEGAGLPHELLNHAEPEALLHEAGQRLRSLVSGMRALLAARAETKTVLGIEANGAINGKKPAVRDNPLRLSTDDEQALMSLLIPPRQNRVLADVAIQRSFDDLQAHELALLARARTAVAEAIAPFDPDNLKSRVKDRSLLSATKKAKYWDLFEAEFKKLRDAGKNGTQNGPLARALAALAQAYEEQDRKP
jgi:type VI secretion system FHA domain protein